MTLEMRKEASKQAHRENVEAFGLDKSPTYTAKFEKMKGMDHGPNHQEGDPAVHTMLVELALNNFLKQYDHELGESDKVTLRLAATLHDVGKADTQQFDAVSAKQNEVVGATEQEVQDAKAEIDGLFYHGELLARLKELAPDETDLIAKVDAVQTKAFSKMGKKYHETGEMSNNDKKGIKKALGLFLQHVPKSVFDPGKFPGIAVNFRGHDEASLELVEKIIQETGQEVSEEALADIKFVVENHMLLLEPDKLTSKKFLELFVEDGEINTRRIDMLRAHTFADDAGRANTRREEGTQLAKIDDAIKKNALAFEKAKAKREAAEKSKRLQAEVFADTGGKASAFLAKKGVTGREMGAGIGKINGVFKRMEGATPEDIRAEIDKIEF
jgi:hypothetical protein